jgi:hypothetical protein
MRRREFLAALLLAMLAPLAFNRAQQNASRVRIGMLAGLLLPPIESFRKNFESPVASRVTTFASSTVSPYSTSSLARTNTDSGNVTPSALAAFMLITRSNFVGCSTGMSPAAVPFRSLST